MRHASPTLNPQAWTLYGRFWRYSTDTRRRQKEISRVISDLRADAVSVAPVRPTLGTGRSGRIGHVGALFPTSLKGSPLPWWFRRLLPPNPSVSHGGRFSVPWPAHTVPLSAGQSRAHFES